MGYQTYLKEVESVFKRIQELNHNLHQEKQHLETLQASAHKFGALKVGETVETERGLGVVEDVYATSRGWLYDISDKNNPEKFLYLKEVPTPWKRKTES